MDFAHTPVSGMDKDGYVAKLDSNLTKQWVDFWIGSGSDQAFGLGFVHNGNIAVTGVTGGNITQICWGA